MIFSTYMMISFPRDIITCFDRQTLHSILSITWSLLPLESGSFSCREDWLLKSSDHCISWRGCSRNMECKPEEQETCRKKLLELLYVTSVQLPLDHSLVPVVQLHLP